MARGTSSVDANVYRRPEPGVVARLVESHGFEAASTRWHWLDKRTLCSLAQSGRAAEGHAPVARPKRRSYTDMDAAVVVEASYALGSTQRGVRAAALAARNGQGIFCARGLTPPSISAVDRGEATRLALGAKNGNADAAAAWEARLEHELAVGRVLRAALALVPVQPATGRYRLPLCDDALREAMSGLPEAAVRAVFPDLDISGPETAPEQLEETPVNETDDRPAQPRGRLPDEATIRADHATGETGVVLAARYGISPSRLYALWRRLGLRAPGRERGYQAALAREAKGLIAPVRPTPRRRRLPDEQIIRADHADGQPLLVLAAHYGVEPQTLYTAWRRYGLSGEGRLAGYVPASVAKKRAQAAAEGAPEQASPPAPEPVTLPVAPSPIRLAPGQPDRLGLDDLLLAERLVRQGATPDHAVAIVRADRAAARPSSNAVIEAWYDALVETGLAETETEKAAAKARYEAACQAFEALCCGELRQ